MSAHRRWNRRDRPVRQSGNLDPEGRPVFHPYGFPMLSCLVLRPGFELYDLTANRKEKEHEASVVGEP